jgi:hypothetical protein
VGSFLGFSHFDPFWRTITPLSNCEHFATLGCTGALRFLCIRMYIIYELEIGSD